MTTLTDLIAEIDALDAKATPGPLCNRYNRRKVITKNWRAGTPVVACFDGNGSVDAAFVDADLYIALRNNWPVLRAADPVVKAAREIVRRIQDIKSECPGSIRVLGEELAAALSALDAELEKVKDPNA